jgi:hypothetical protein
MTFDVALTLAIGFVLGCYCIGWGLENLGEGIGNGLEEGLDKLGRWMSGEGDE